MSANNYLLVRKIKSGGYKVQECDADTDHCSQISKHATFEEAVRAAQAYQEENIIEYGIHIEEG